MRTAWLEWYCIGSPKVDCVDLPSSLSFHNRTSSKAGILTFMLPDAISPAATFAWLYLPTILAVFYALLWQIVDDEVKRTEPFYQAQLPSGATAASSLFASYFSVPPVLVPLQAMRWRQAAVVLSSTTYVLVGFITPILQSQMFQIQNQVIQVGYNSGDSLGFIPFQRGSSFSTSESIVGYFTDSLSLVDIDGRFPGLTNDAKLQNIVYLDPTYARVQEAILLLGAVTGALLLLVLRSRALPTKSSLTGLGSLASLAAPYPDFAADMAPLAESKDHQETVAVKKRMASRILHLGSRNEDQSNYGFWFEPCAAHEHDSNDPAASTHDWKRKWIGPYSMLNLVTSISWFAYILLMSMILIVGGLFNKDTANPAEIFSKAAQSRGEKAQIGYSAFNLVVVSVVKSLWVIVEEHATSLSQFRSLSRKSQRAYPIFLHEYQSMPIVWRTYRALCDGELLLASLTVISILLEVCLTCFGFTASMAQGQGFNLDAMYALHLVAFAICAMMFFVTGNFLGFVVRKIKVVERNPDTLGMRLSYLCKSKSLLEDFAPMQVMDDKEKEAYLRAMPYAYSLVRRGCETHGGQLLYIQVIDRVEES